MKKSELHLMVIWERARSKQSEIINDISQYLKIVDAYEIEWTKGQVASNFTRFYGVKLPNRSFKEKECGIGPFVLLILLDENPKYEERTTSHGVEFINCKMFDLKSKYREWTWGGHKIHATNTPEETNHDLTLLLGINYEDYLKGIKNDWNGEIKKLQRDITGNNGWDSLHEFFYVINNTLKYVVLRGDENLYTEENSEDHADIDILVENYQNAIFLINGTQLYKYPIRPKVSIIIKGREYIFDLWDANLNYHSKSWHDSMLKNRIKKDFYYYLDPENDFYSRIYHCLIHKAKTAEDYYPYFENKFYDLGLSERYDLKAYNNPMDVYYQLLIDYMHKNNYEFLKEDRDYHCYFNSRIANIGQSLQYINHILDINNLRPYKVDLNSDSAYSYFTGIYDGKKVFIKYGGVGNSCENEYKMTTKANKRAPNHFLPIIYSHIQDSHSFIVYEFLNGKSLKEQISAATQVELDNLRHQLSDIYYALCDLNILHRDIRPDNFVVTENGDVLLLDLQFAIDSSNPQELECLKNNRKLALRLGDVCRYKKYAWKDSFSFSKTCEFLGLEMLYDRGILDKEYRIPLYRILKFKYENFVELVWGGAKS